MWLRAEVVKAGAKGSDAPKYVFGAMGFAAVLEILKSDKGLQIFREYVEGFWAFPKSVVHHFNFQKQPIGDVVHGGGIYWSTPNLSPALMGIGYIIGPELASINASGGVIAWWVMIPLLLFFDPNLPARLGMAQNAAWDVVSYSVWYNIVRPIAVGTMLVGACHTLYSMRASILQSLAGAFGASARAAHEGRHLERTDRDIPFQWLLIGTVVLTVAMAAIYYFFTGSLKAAVIAALIMSVTGFLLSAVGGYLVGLVGSSNQPLSGLTLSALVLSAAGDAGHRRSGHGRGGRGVGSGSGGVLRLFGFRLSDSGLEGRTPARRHALEDAGGGDPFGADALDVFDAADHGAARSQFGHGRNWRARLTGSAGRSDGATGQGHCRRDRWHGA